ncbi:MAG: hypothetical protein V4726_03585 [Verrucomicrobiota bacterium]
MPPSPQDPFPADSENNTPDAPATRPAPLRDPQDKSDVGCLLMLLALFIGIFFLPAIFLLGGAPLVIPCVLMLLFAVVTPVLNPAERMAPRPKWIGRLVIFLTLSGFIIAGWWYVYSHAAPVLRE